MTSRLVVWMGKQAIKRTFASIAEEVGCTEFTVRAVFSDYVNELEKTWGSCRERCSRLRLRKRRRHQNNHWRFQRKRATEPIYQP